MADRLTVPVNPPVSVTTIGPEPEPHCGMVIGGKRLSVKPAVGVTVSVIVVLAVSVPEVPVIIIG